MKHIPFYCFLFLSCLCLQTLHAQSSKSRVLVALVSRLDCPVCQYYMPKLNTLAATMPEVRFEFVFPTEDLTPKQARRVLKRATKAYTNVWVRTDAQGAYRQKMPATVTPEVFVFSAQDSLVYRGAIDDKYISLGSYRQSISRDFLAEALLFALGSTTTLEVSYFSPVGCLLNSASSK